MGHAHNWLASSAPALDDPTPIASSAEPIDALTNGLASTSLGSAPSPVVAATVTDDEEDEEDEATGVEARFFPPLSMQRRTFILSKMRAESVRTVCEIGCGDGGLLHALCQPAQHRDEFPPWRAPDEEDVDEPVTPQSDRSSGPSRQRCDIDGFYRGVPAVPMDQRELHITRVVGVDIDDEAIDSALFAVKPPPVEDDPDDFFAARERWEPLQSAIYKGSLAVYNGDLDGIDCFVLTEVIEHLDDPALRRFGSMVLGVYRPRLVIVSTPNYDFSRHFVASSEQSRAQHTWPDPTGRTERIFRNSDHKFEWTQAEFEAWARGLALEYDYEVSFGGVGSVASYLGRQPADVTGPLYATQCATFRRKHANESERSPRSPMTQPLPFYQQRMRSSSSIQKAVVAKDGNAPPSTDSHFTAPHVLVGAFTFPVQATADRSVAPSADVRKCVRTLLQDSMCQRRAPLNELWGRRPLRLLCRGRVGAVVDALLRAPEAEADDWALKVDDARTGIDAVTVEFSQFDEYEYEALSDDVEESDEGEDASDDGAPPFGWPPTLATDEGNGIVGPRFTELDGWDRAAADLPGASQVETTGWE